MKYVWRCRGPVWVSCDGIRGDRHRVRCPPNPYRNLCATQMRALLSLAYGRGLRAGEVVRLKQSKGRKDRNVMLSPDTLDLLRQWWKTPRRGLASTTRTPQSRTLANAPVCNLLHRLCRPCS